MLSRSRARTTPRTPSARAWPPRPSGRAMIILGNGQIHPPNAIMATKQSSSTEAAAAQFRTEGRDRPGRGIGPRASSSRARPTSPAKVPLGHFPSKRSPATPRTPRNRAQPEQRSVCRRRTPTQSSGRGFGDGKGAARPDRRQREGEGRGGDALPDRFPVRRDRPGRPRIKTIRPRGPAPGPARPGASGSRAHASTPERG